jgi:2-aminoadipate transaminase
VGRGSFVLGGQEKPAALPDWLADAPVPAAVPPAAPPDAISFATARPAEELFPVEEFRASCDEVLSSPAASAILQLGSPYGYGPLREHLLGEARAAGLVRPGDDLIVTSGCQQALDLLQRILLKTGDTVLLEDPAYSGLRNLFLRAGVELAGVPVGTVPDAQLGRVMVTTPNFQNPTGMTLGLETRQELLRVARRRGLVIIENDTYGELRYTGRALPSLKELDEEGRVILLRSFSKVTFPGLRVGWVLGPAALVARLAEAKQLADLHTDQLSQAALLRFAESGRLAAHRERVVAAGGERLRAVLAACEQFLPAGTHFTRPEGGMNLWVRLPRPLDSFDLLARAHREGVAYIPGRFFEVSRSDPGALRLSFAGLRPEEIRRGLEILGRIVSNELARAKSTPRSPAPAMV